MKEAKVFTGAVNIDLEKRDLMEIMGIEETIEELDGTIQYYFQTTKKPSEAVIKMAGDGRMDIILYFAAVGFAEMISDTSKKREQAGNIGLLVGGIKSLIKDLVASVNKEDRGKFLADPLIDDEMKQAMKDLMDEEKRQEADGETEKK